MTFSVFCTGFFVPPMRCGPVNEPDDDRDERILRAVLAGAEIYYGLLTLSLDERMVSFGASSGMLGISAAQNVLIAISASNEETEWKYPLGALEVRSAPAVGPGGSNLFCGLGKISRRVRRPE